jgi:hypothetical protein
MVCDPRFEPWIDASTALVPQARAGYRAAAPLSQAGRIGKPTLTFVIPVACRG